MYNFTTEIEELKSYYGVSCGPIMTTSHLYKSSSSIRPAENPSTGFLFKSTEKIKMVMMYNGKNYLMLEQSTDCRFDVQLCVLLPESINSIKAETILLFFSEINMFNNRI